MSSRDKILNAIRTAKKVPSHLPDDPDVEPIIKEKLQAITPETREGLIDQFQSELEKVSGIFKRFSNKADMVEAINAIFKEKNYTEFSIAGNGTAADLAADIEKSGSAKAIAGSEVTENRQQRLASVPASLVDAKYAIADTGTLCVPFTETASHLPYVLSECVITVVYPDQFVANHFDLFESAPAEEMKNMVLITGASRTADIEKILFLGAHGPRDFYVFLLDE